jgi:hypothetical protein
MLEGMVQAGYGSLSLYESEYPLWYFCESIREIVLFIYLFFQLINIDPIDCDCHLAWLIQHKPELLAVVDGGQCSNSTLFTDLNADAFADCPVFTCPANIDGNFPNPLSCSSYYVCSNGNDVLVVSVL